jgi:hypothetical protein
LTNFYGASVNKITGLLGVYQLLAEANELLKTTPTIADSVDLESALKDFLDCRRNRGKAPSSGGPDSDRAAGRPSERRNSSRSGCLLEQDQ